MRFGGGGDAGIDFLEGVGDNVLEVLVAELVFSIMVVAAIFVLQVMVPVVFVVIDDIAATTEDPGLKVA